LPSRPGEFHPEPLTDPDLILSYNFIFSKQIRPRLSATSRSETICAYIRKWLQHMKTKSAEPATSALTTPTPTPDEKAAWVRDTEAKALVWFAEQRDRRPRQT
jgi:hypothetical protein